MEIKLAIKLTDEENLLEEDIHRDNLQSVDDEEELLSPLYENAVNESRKKYI